MKLYIAFTIFLLNLFFSSNRIVAQTIIKGRITELKTNIPIPYTNIIIKGTFNGTTSNKQGFYKLKLNSGKHRLIVSHIAYKNYQKEFEINKNDTLVFNISLKKKTEQLGVVAVYGKTKEPNSKFSFNSNSAKNLPSLGEPDLIRIVSFLPGVVQTNDFKTTLNIRGGHSDQNQFLLDGIEVFNPQHMNGIFSAFNLWGLENIDVYAGNFPAKFSGKLSGIISTQTISPKQPNTIKANLSLVSTTVLATHKWGNTFAALSGRRTYIDFITSLFGSTFPFKFYDINLKVNHKFSEQFDIDLIGYTNVDSDNQENSDASIGNLLGGLHLNYNFDNYKNSLTFSQTKYFINNKINTKTNNKTFNINDNLKEINLRYDGELTKNIFHLTYGVIFHKYKISHKWNTKNNNNLNNAFHTGLPANFNFTDHSDLLSFYLSSSWIIKDHFFVKGIFRYHFFRNMKYLSPGISLDWNILSNLKFNLSAQKNYQFIAAGIEGRELTLSAPLYLLESPMKARIYTCGIDFEPFEGYRTRTEFYYKSFDKIIKLNEDDKKYPAFESGKGKAFGLDIFIEKNIGRITFQLAYSYLNVAVNYKNKWVKPAWDIPHSFKGLVGFRLGRTWLVNTALTYRSGSPYLNAIGSFWGIGGNKSNTYFATYYNNLRRYAILSKNNYLRLSSYFRLDFALRKKYKNKYFDWILYIQVQNITFHRNELRKNWQESFKSNSDKTDVSLPIIPSVGVEFEF